MHIHWMVSGVTFTVVYLAKSHLLPGILECEGRERKRRGLMSERGEDGGREGKMEGGRGR